MKKLRKILAPKKWPPPPKPGNGEPKHTETLKLGVNIAITTEMAERCKSSKPARDKVCKEVVAVIRSQLINGPPYAE